MNKVLVIHVLVDAGASIASGDPVLQVMVQEDAGKRSASSWQVQGVVVGVYSMPEFLMKSKLDA